MSVKIGLIFWLIVFLTGYRVMAQNLVPNGNFESKNCCPNTGAGQPFSCVNQWFQPLSTSTADFFHLCSWNSFLGINDFLGYAFEPGNDSSVAGFANYVVGYNGGEYLEIQLLKSLEHGKKYCLDFLLQPTKSYLLSDAIDICFTVDSLLLDTSAFFYGVSPQISNPSGNIIRDTSKWTSFHGEFIAGGGEKFMTIGTFRLNSETQWDTSGTSGASWAYYFIDNVILTECVNPADTLTHIYFAPNVASDQTTLVYSVIKEEEPGYISIFDVNGRLVYKRGLKKEGYQHIVNVTSFAQGLYIWKVHTNSKVIETGKLEIIR